MLRRLMSVQSYLERRSRSLSKARKNRARTLVRHVHRELYEYVRRVPLEQILAINDSTLPRRLEDLLHAYWRVVLRLKRVGISLSESESRRVSGILESWRWLRPRQIITGRGICR